jgi:hypothetical protein
MNFKTTYVLFGVLTGLLVLFGLVLFLNPTTAPDANYVLPSLHDEKNPVKETEITAVTVKHAGKDSLAFTRDEDTKLWRMTEPMKLKPQWLDRAAVETLVRDVFGARRDDKANLKGSLKDYGLETPAYTVTIKKGDKEWWVGFGEEHRTSGGETAVVYAVSSDRPREPMALRLREVDAYAKTANDYRSKNLLADSSFNVQGVTLMDGTHTPIILKRVGSEQRWRFDQPNYGEAEYGEAGLAPAAAPKTLTGIRSLLEILSAFKVDYKSDKENDFVSESPRDLAQYGLEPRDKLLQIKVTRTLDGSSDKTVSDTLIIGKPVDEKGEKRYAMLEDQGFVVKVPAANLEALTKFLENPSALRDKDLLRVEEPKVDVVAVKTAAGSFELFKSGTGFVSEWKLFREGQPAAKADGGAVTGLINALLARKGIKSFPDNPDLKALGLDQPAVVISLWEGGIQPEEKKDEKKDEKKPEGDKPEEKKDPNAKPKLKSDKPTVKLSFGKVEGDNVYVLRETADDTKTVVTVAKSLFDSANRGALSYLDKSLPSFEGDPNRVVLERGGVTTKIEKEKDKNTWKFLEPKEMADKPVNADAVENIINLLKSMRAVNLVAETSTPDKEAEYGLNAPSNKVTLSVTKDDKTEDHVYLFGKDAPDGIYAKQADKPLIFVAGKFVQTTLNAELRDPVVYKFDHNKVTAVKMVGWSNKIGSPFTLELERKSPTDWTVKSTTLPIMTFDAAKAESFLTAIETVRADRFLNKTGPQPTGMDVKDGALSIEVTLSEGGPIQLTVGNDTEIEGKKYWFATSNKAPGETFLIAKQMGFGGQVTDPFEKVRAEPPSLYFNKK